jgi:hypothetical protein
MIALHSIGDAPMMALAVSLVLANATPQAAIAAYGRAMETNSVAEMSAAFQPSAIMYCTGPEGVRATYQSQWKARLREAPPSEAPVSTTIEWLDAGQTTALARATAVRGTRTFGDYLLLARLGGDWKIVGKLCQAGAAADPVAEAAIGAVIDAKLASDRHWDPDLLLKSIDPRALVMTVEDGQLVAASAAEWQARYAERRVASPDNPVVEIDRKVDARGSIGVARWSFRTPAGRTWTDRALVLKTDQGWRMMALLFVGD